MKLNHFVYINEYYGQLDTYIIHLVKTLLTLLDSVLTLLTLGKIEFCMNKGFIFYLMLTKWGYKTEE